MPEYTGKRRCIGCQRGWGVRLKTLKETLMDLRLLFRSLQKISPRGNGTTGVHGLAIAKLAKSIKNRRKNGQKRPGRYLRIFR